MGDSAGYTWVAQFNRELLRQVGEIILVGKPKAILPQNAGRFLPRSMTLFTEYSNRIGNDDRGNAGLTRVFNAIDRVPILSRRSTDFMVGRAASDLVSIEESYSKLFLSGRIRLIANKAPSASIVDVAHLHFDWVRDLHSWTEDALCTNDDAKDTVGALPSATFQALEGTGHLVLGQKLDFILDFLFAYPKPEERAGDSFRLFNGSVPTIWSGFKLTREGPCHVAQLAKILNGQPIGNPFTSLFETEGSHRCGNNPCKDHSSIIQHCVFGANFVEDALVDRSLGCRFNSFCGEGLTMLGRR